MKERIRLAWLAGINLALLALEIGWFALANGIWWRDNSNWWTHEIPFFLSIGVMYGHVLVVGALASMGPWRWQVRISVMILIWFAIVAGESLLVINILSHPPPPPVFYILAASTVIIVLVLQLPLGPRFRLWRLRNFAAVDEAGSSWATFSLKELLLWTGIVGVMLGIVRLVTALFQRSQDADYLAIIGMVAFMLLLAAPPTILLLALELPIGTRFGFFRPLSPFAPAPVLSEQEKNVTFGLRDLFIWITIIALILAGVRVLVALAPDAPGFDEMIGRVVIIFSEFVAGTLLIAWPLFWALWSSRGWWWKMLVSLCIAILGTVLEGVVLFTTLRGGPGGILELLLLISVMNLTTYLVLASHAAALRVLGYRLA